MCIRIILHEAFEDENCRASAQFYINHEVQVPQILKSSRVLTIAILY
jgi:hypothetical protein